MPPDEQQHNERELLRLTAEGDEVAFRALFDRYSRKIYSLAMYLTHSEFLAEEITQEVFMKIWVKRADLLQVEYFNAYLKTIAKNTASNYLKRIAHEKLILQQKAYTTPQSDQPVENTVVSKNYQQILQEAIDQLPPQQKTAYLLSRAEGLKYEEIAEKMQLSHYTVKEYIKKALRSIRDHLHRRIELSVAAAIALFLK